MDSNGVLKILGGVISLGLIKAVWDRLPVGDWIGDHLKRWSSSAPLLRSELTDDVLYVRVTNRGRDDEFAVTIEHIQGAQDAHASQFSAKWEGAPEEWRMIPKNDWRLAQPVVFDPSAMYGLLHMDAMLKANNPSNISRFLEVGAVYFQRPGAQSPVKVTLDQTNTADFHEVLDRKVLFDVRVVGKTGKKPAVMRLSVGYNRAGHPTCKRIEP